MTTSEPSRNATHQAAGLLQPMPANEDRARRQRRAPWVAVSGGKGGVGKTLLSVNLALLAQRSGVPTLLVDFDPGLGNVGVHLRLAPRHDLEDLAQGRCSAEEAAVRGPADLAVLCGRSGSTFLTGTETAVRRALAAVEVAAEALGADLVIVDTGAGIGPSVIAAAERAKLTLVTTTPDPAALTDAYALTKMLFQRQRARPRLVLNSVSNREHAMRTSARIQGVCKKFLGQELPLAGWLRRDPMFALSVADQRPLALGQHPAVEDLRSIYAAVLSELPARTRTRTSGRRATGAAVARPARL